jgi:hypothetical protein
VQGIGVMRLLLLLALVVEVPAGAAPPPAAVREIEGLIAALGASGCDFQRNGSWYPAKKAEQHLRRKYDYLRERDKIATAEQFIELAGARSSMSGRAYLVRCPGKPVVDSAAWLQGRLRVLRGAGPTSSEPR